MLISWVCLFSPQNVGVEFFQRACVAEYCHSLSQADSATGGSALQEDQTARNAATAAICATVAAFAAECERVTSRPLSWRSEEFCREWHSRTWDRIHAIHRVSAQVGWS